MNHHHFLPFLPCGTSEASGSSTEHISREPGAYFEFLLVTSIVELWGLGLDANAVLESDLKYWGKTLRRELSDELGLTDIID